MKEEFENFTETATKNIENSTMIDMMKLLNEKYSYLLHREVENEMPTFSIDEYGESFSVITDQIILDTKKGERLAFKSGKLELLGDENSRSFNINVQFYFEKECGEWVIRSAKACADLSVLTKEAQTELLEEGKINFYITEPFNETTIK